MKLLLHPILFSIIAGGLIVIIPKKFRQITEKLSLLSAVYLFIACIRIFLHGAFEDKFLYLDGLARLVVAGIGFFGALVTWYSQRSMVSYKDANVYYANVIWTIGFSILAAVSNNIILLLLAWGFLGWTLFMLINISGACSAEIAKKAFIIIGGTDSVMIFGFGLIWLITGDLTLSNIKIAIGTPISFWSFLFISVAAFAKAGAMPFHTWVPDTAKDAPIPVTALLPASLDKLLGIYLLARLVLNVYVLNEFTCALLMIIGGVTIVAAVMMALVQHDFKKLLGYHAVSQAGYMVIGLGTGNPIGIAGGLFHMVNNAIYKCCLFLSCGNVEYKTKKSDLDSLGGLAKIMPITFLTSLIAALAISGVPPFNGFFSKWMIYQGIIEKGKAGGIVWIFCLIAAMFGSGLTLASFIKLIHAIFLGKPSMDNGPSAARNEVSFSMWAGPVILAVLCAVFGVFAYIIPLKQLIIPALEGSSLNFIGIWQPLKAAVFLIAGLGIGCLIYLFGNLKGIRETGSYIGGEEIEDKMRLSGTEFYGTIKQAPFIKGVYLNAEKKLFDIYEQGKRIVFSFIHVLRYLHNGVLPTYLVWCLLGMIALLFYIVK